MKWSAATVVAFSSMALSSTLARAFSRTTSTFTSRSTLRMAATMSGGATSTSTTNPLLQPDDLPQFARITPADLTPAVQTLLEQLQHDFQQLEAQLSNSKNVDYDAVLPALERLQYPLSFAWGVAGHLNGVANGEELRQAYQENQPQIVQAQGGAATADGNASRGNEEKENQNEEHVFFFGG